jgi:hypothetical protein
MASLQEGGAPQVDVAMDEELRRALAESAEDWEGDKEAKKAKTTAQDKIDQEQLLILASLPGVDMTDPRIQEALKKKREEDGK